MQRLQEVTLPGQDEYGREGASKERKNEQDWRVGMEGSKPAVKTMSPIETALKEAGMRPQEIEETAAVILKSIEKMGVKAPPPEQEKTVGLLIGSAGTPDVVRAVTNMAVEEVRTKQAFSLAPQEKGQTMKATGYKISHKP